MNPPDDSPKNGGQDTLSGLPSYMRPSTPEKETGSASEHASLREGPETLQTRPENTPPPSPAASSGTPEQAAPGIAVSPDGTATLPDEPSAKSEPLSMGWDYSGGKREDDADHDAEESPDGGSEHDSDWNDELLMEEGEKAPSFFSEHPVLRVEQTMPPSLMSRLFTVLALLPIVTLAVIIVAQTLFSLDARALWYSDEVRHAAAFQELLKGNWLLLHMNGVPYPDKPPLYFWFLRGIYELIKTDGPLLFFLGTAVSALLYLCASLTLARLVARVDGKTTLASGIILLCGGYMMGVMHYSRMDLFFAFLIIASHIVLYHAWLKKSSLPLMVLGFGLAGLAVLTKGPLGLVLPLASSILFLCWRGTPLRLFRMDVLAGLVFSLLLIGAWLGGVYMEADKLFRAGQLQVNGQEYLLNEILKKQVVERAVDAFHHKESWFYYFIGVPLMLLPWTVLFLVLPWHRFLGKGMRSGIAASRRPEGEGYAFLWCMVIGAFAVLSAASSKILIYFLPALPALSIIMGRALLQVSGARAALFKHLTALMMLLCGLVFLWVLLMLHDLMPVPETLYRLLPLAATPDTPGWHIETNAFFFLVPAGFFVGAVFLWLGLRSNRPEGVLLISALVLTAISYPLWVMVAPALDPVLSPKAQAEVMKGFIQKGYAPISFKDYGATYTYYAGFRIEETRDWNRIASLAAEKKKVVLAIRAKEWEPRADKPDCFAVVHKQWLELNEHLLLACPAPPEAPRKEPAAVQQIPAAPEAAPETEEPGSPAQSPEESPAAPEGTTLPPVEAPAGDHAPAAPEQGDASAPAPAEPEAAPEQTPEQAPKETAPAAPHPEEKPEEGITPAPDAPTGQETAQES